MPLPFLTFNVINAIAKTTIKVVQPLLSLILLNEVFNKQNKFETSHLDQMFKMASNLRARDIPTTLTLISIKGFLAISRLLSLDAKFSVICRTSAHGCCRCSLKTYSLTAFNVDRRLFFSYIWRQFLFQRTMPFRNFDYQLYVLISVLYMRKTQIK